MGSVGVGAARVVPVVVRDVDWSATPIGKLQVLPRDGIPVALWPHRDSAWRSVAEGIAAVAEELRAKRREPRSERQVTVREGSS